MRFGLALVLGAVVAWVVLAVLIARYCLPEREQ